jgi:nuclear GTP-binding protein
MTEDLLKILKKHARLLKSEEKQIITVGVVGFPNVGKSSIINALKKSRATVVNHLPGTTKVLQEIILDKSILVLDCPGVIPTA